MTVKVYLGSGNDSLLDAANYIKKELPHLNITIHPLTELKHGKNIQPNRCRQPRGTTDSTDINDTIS